MMSQPQSTPSWPGAAGCRWVRSNKVPKTLVHGECLDWENGLGSYADRPRFWEESAAAAAAAAATPLETIPEGQAKKRRGKKTKKQPEAQ